MKWIKLSVGFLLSIINLLGVGLPLGRRSLGFLRTEPW